jgi:hypothetical protein
MRIPLAVITLTFAFLSVEGVPLDGSIAVPRSPSGPTGPSSCSEVGDPTVDSATRWQKAGADDAFTKATQYYNQQRLQGGSLTFSRAVSHYFNGPENFDCQLISGPCDAGVSKCETVSSPAGWLILNSFANFHNVRDHNSPNSPLLTYNGLSD